MNAGLDVSEVLADPMLASSFTVIRRSEVLGQNGRVNIDPVNLGEKTGVVYPTGRNDLARLDDQQMMGKHINIVTDFRLQGPAPGFQPDLIGWHGDFYVVQLLDDYTDFGAGFVQAVAGSMSSVDQPPQVTDNASTLVEGAVE